MPIIDQLSTKWSHTLTFWRVILIIGVSKPTNPPTTTLPLWSLLWTKILCSTLPRIIETLEKVSVSTTFAQSRLVSVLTTPNFLVSVSTTYKFWVSDSPGLDNPDTSQSQKVSVSTTLICLSLATSVILSNGVHIDSCLLFINLTLFVKSICIYVTFSSHIKLVWPYLILVSVSTLGNLETETSQKLVSVSVSMLRLRVESLSLDIETEQWKSQSRFWD